MPLFTRLTFFVGLRTRHGARHNKNSALHTAIVPILASHGIDGFNATETSGFWKGEPEESLTISTLVQHPCGNDVLLAHEISLQLAEALEQECVLYTAETVAGDFVYAPPVETQAAAPARSPADAAMTALLGVASLEKERLDLVSGKGVPIYD